MGFDFLDAYDHEQLVQLSLEVNQRIQRARGNVEVADQESVYMPLISALAQYAGEAPYFGVFRKQACYAKFKRCVPQLLVYMDNFGDLARVEWLYVLKHFFIYLCEWLLEVGCPLSVTTLVNNMDKIPGIVNQRYPGYVDNGLGPLIGELLIQKAVL